LILFWKSGQRNIKSPLIAAVPKGFPNELIALVVKNGSVGAQQNPNLYD